MQKSLHVCLLMATAAMAITAHPATAAAQEQSVRFHIPTQDLASALQAFGEIARRQIVFDQADLRGKQSAPLIGTFRPSEALARLLANSGLGVATGQSGVLIIRPARNPGQTAPGTKPGVQGTNAQGAQPRAEPDPSQDIIVTAQKREENIQTVPIAVSAFSKKNLDEYKIEGGAELLRAIPNVTFSKNNFSGYNFSIRGIGTKAISVTTDPAVAISFNNTPLIRNRLFEQEYFDVERVEVLRGPQGTLYGRNATGGVVNMITAKPTDVFEGEIKAEVGNFDTKRMRGMINIPIGDTLAVRLAGALTKRDGFDFNTVTDRHVNGRDLWSGRGTISWKPTDNFRTSFIWEHFDENDDRSRTGKQLCHRDPGITQLGGTTLPADLQPLFNQSCVPGSLYDAGAYGTPDASSLPFVYAAGMSSTTLGYIPGTFTTLDGVIRGIDPFAGIVQSRNLREIATSYDPVFRAKNDIFQFNAEFDLNDDLTFFSQTAYTKDRYYSSQDYNRFESVPLFNNSDQPLLDVTLQPITGPGLLPGGIYTDPQLGPSSRMLSVDINQSRSKQWSQEFRLQSSYAGRFNFSIGANYQHFKINEDYYVFNNLFSLLAQGLFAQGNFGGTVLDCKTADVIGCVYTDPNPLNQIDGEGHNYFRSSNLYKVRSFAAFGEAYWKATDDLKITLGLRYTDDKKTSTPVPSQLLLADGRDAAGFVRFGYPKSPDIVQNWGRLTGRLAVDWDPHFSFTDDTLIYASYSRGYKGGGTNPPGIGVDPDVLKFAALPQTFKPETVNAYEVGIKNTLADGKLTLNGSAFYYDYNNYQVSQIVDRIALNENFNTTTWGAELEATWRPTPRLRLNANLGYLDTKIGKGMESIDTMDRLQGHTDWAMVRPWLQLASNCVAPVDKINAIVTSFLPIGLGLNALCGGTPTFGDFSPGGFFSSIYGFTYDPLTDAPNGGRGFAQDLSGNEMPNSPHWTMNLGAQYTLPIGEWDATLRGDYYRQGKSWARVYNAVNDRLKAWDNANLSLTVARASDGLAFQLYVKNLFNDTPITDAFVNSDDSGLTTNVFTLDPRIIGFSVTKAF